MKVYDPCVSQIETRFGTFRSEDLREIIAWADAIILAVNHSYFIKTLPNLLTEISSKKRIAIVDAKNILSKPPKSSVYIKLGSGRDFYERNSWDPCL